MLDLPSDIQVGILDYIHSKVDLNALCLTCKGLLTVVTPYLDRDIYIHTWGREQHGILHFLEGMLPSAGRSMQHIRSLTLEDERSPREPTTLQTGPFNFDTNDAGPLQYAESDQDGEATRDQQILSLLRILPNGCLHTFRFSADRPLSWEIAAHLQAHQRQLRHLCTTIWIKDLDVLPEADMQSINDIHIFPLHTLDIRIARRKQVLFVLRSIFLMPDLRRLSLSRSSEESQKDVRLLEDALLDFWESWHETEPQLLKLESLRIHNFYVYLLSAELTDGIVRNPKETQPLVQHVHIDMEVDSFTNGLHWLSGLRDSSPNISSFRFCGGLDTQAVLGKRISSMGPRLKSFGWHDRSNDSDYTVNWAKIFPHFTYIEELGIQLSESSLDTKGWGGAATDSEETTTEFEKNCLRTHLKHLTKLRTLHFRYARYRELSKAEHARHKRPKEINWEFQRFANAFFQYMDAHAMCPMLDALALGMFWDIDMDEREPYFYHVRRHCFIKGYQIDVLGRKTAVAVPVPAYALRQAQPVSGILDLDPECEWVGAQPRRLEEI